MSAFGILVAIVLTLIVVRRAFGARPIAGEDVMFHTVRAIFGGDLLRHGRLDGWLSQSFLGHQGFLVYGPGLSWEITVIRLLTFGTLSIDGAVKVTALLNFIALAPAAAFACRSLGFTRRAASVTAITVILVGTPFGIGLQGTFGTGLHSHAAGAVWFFVAFGALMRVTQDPRRRRIVSAAAALAMLAITHVISLGILALVIAPVLVGQLIARRVSRRALIGLLVVGLLAFGLASFQLVPQLAHRDLTGVWATWATPSLGDRLSEIWHGELLYPKWFVAEVLAGWIFAIVNMRAHRIGGAVVFAPLAALAVSHIVATQVQDSIVAVQLANRGLGYFGVLALFPFAAALAHLIEEFETRRAIYGAISLIAVAALTWLNLGMWREMPGQAPAVTPAMTHAADVLPDLVPRGARISVQRDYPAEFGRTGTINPATWLARYSGVPVVNTTGVESSTNRSGAMLVWVLNQMPPATQADLFSVLGVSHFVTTRPDTTEALLASPRFSVAWREDPLAILEVQSPRGQPEPGALLSTDVDTKAKLVSVADERLTIEYEAAADTEARISIAYSPKWRAELDAQPLSLRRGSSKRYPNDNVLTTSLPAGRHRIALRYTQRDTWETTGQLISVITLLALARLALRSGRTRTTRRRLESPAP